MRFSRYDIAGEGKWKLTVKNNAMTLEKADQLSGCIATMSADGETFVGVNTGKVDATNAFMSGKFKVEGDMGAFGKTGKLFPQIRPRQKGDDDQRVSCGHVRHHRAPL